ncbi:hypothetical protein MHU86_12103 [Fragilaria crotonensis]|nr:hypothetical protein MHU86_12103 [Fragilaria crotonensis]
MSSESQTHQLSVEATELVGTTSSTPQRHQCEVVRLKPSPRSSLSCASNDATPTLALETSFAESHAFFLLSPSELQVSDLVTYSPKPFLLPRSIRRDDTWSTAFNSTDMLPQMDEIPRRSQKRLSEKDFVLVRKRLRPDRDYFGSETASSFAFPDVVRAADEERSFNVETTVASTPKPRSSSFGLSPPRMRPASPDQTTHFFRCNSALALPLLL